MINYYFKIIKQELEMLPQLARFVFSKKKKAVYVGCTGMGNLGDEVVYDAIASILSNLCFYNVQYKNHKAGKYGRKLILKKVDYLILGGGTIIKKDAKSGYLRIINDLRMQYPNAKIIVFGAGVADPVLAAEVGYPTNLEDWSEFLNACSLIAVRGILSQRLLKSAQWAVHKDIHVLHDPALYFLESKVSDKLKLKKIGLNFCDIVGRIYGRDEVKVERFVNQLIEKLIENSWEITLYPTVSTDIAYMIRIIDAELLKKIKVYHDFIDVKKSLSFFNGIDVFIGQRLHSIVFSSITYTPFHAIEYESKTSDFLNTLGLYDYSNRTDSLDVGFIMKRLDYLYSNIELEQMKLFELCQKAKQEQIKVAKMIQL